MSATASHARVGSTPARVSSQLQTLGGLSSALSFKNTSQALNIYYSPPRWDVPRPSRASAPRVFSQTLEKPAEISLTCHKLTTFICLASLISMNSHSASALPGFAFSFFFQNAQFFFVWAQQNTSGTFFFSSADQPTWHFPEKKVNSFHRAVSKNSSLFISCCSTYFFNDKKKIKQNESK